MLRFISATLVTAIMLSGCNQDTATQITENRPAAEPPEVASKDFGDYTVHFSAMSTDLLEPEVARTYNIVRSKNRAMLSISIIRKIEDTTGKSVTADIQIAANNLTGQVKNLVLRKIQEGDAIYYIGDVQVANAETLVFDLDVKPEESATRFSVRFSRQFFSD
jgi:hypothetical protein